MWPGLLIRSSVTIQKVWSILAHDPKEILVHEINKYKWKKKYLARTRKFWTFMTLLNHDLLENNKMF